MTTDALCPHLRSVGYPEAMDAEFHESRRVLARLKRTREFRFEDGTSLDWLHLNLEKFSGNIFLGVRRSRQGLVDD
jgi:hypothetical protein